ncbi:hypothetical protein FACS189437_09260 [Bacteroidia bacterium]|nr:hypothetical protein FACS189437_09260 [Bacteroidia bacterium]
MEREIIFSEESKALLKELLIVLYTKGYFSLWENAKKYVDSVVHYVVRYIGVLHGKDAPLYFSRYGTNLKYITYRANKNTWWYIFYQQHDNVFLIRHITNNHVAAQYFDN